MEIINILKTKPHNEHYLARYLKFIENCINTNDYATGRYEEHHICPKAKDMFPEYISFKKNPWNMARLSPRQHFIAHWILSKTYPSISSNLVALSIIKKDYQNRYLVGRLNKGKATVVDSAGKILSVSINDPRYLAGELVGVHKNTKWITNGVDNKHIAIIDSIPEGWRLGLTKNVSKYIYINNGEINKQLAVNEVIPEGWIRGKLVKSKNKQVWINNGVVNKKLEVGADIPEGWVLGKYGFSSNEGKIYVNNGTSNRLIDPKEGIPEGWERGLLRVNSIKGSVRITNGIINKFIPKNESIPEGWRKGMTKKYN